MDDNSIIELFNARSEDAVSALSEQYGALCRKTAGNILTDGRDIEECLKDTFLCIWNRIPPERPSSLKAFVCRIVKNTALKRVERESALISLHRYMLKLIGKTIL